MIDLDAIKQNIDLRALAGQHATLTGNGKELKGPCPKCGGKDRFYCQADFFACRKCHPTRGDAIEFASWLNGLDFKAAIAWLTNGNPPTVTELLTHRPPRPARPPLHPPPLTWRDRAAEFIAYAQAQLLQPDNRAGLDYLHGRGLTDETIGFAGLGYNPRDLKDRAARWGVVNRETIWLPAGVVIPWQVDGAFHRVNIRLIRPRRDANGGELKYIGPAGWSQSNPIYNADGMTPGKPILLVEGEFCALTVEQEAGDLVNAVATGSKDAGRAGRWLARLAAAPLVLVSFDAEPGKGDAAARRWLDLLPNAKRWRPLLKDVNDMHRAGLSVRQWVESGVSAK